MAANLDAALREAIRDGVLEMNVEIEFSALPPATQLAALSLKSEGNLAWGILSRDKIQAIASLPQVVAIRLTKRTVERAVQTGQRIAPRLMLEMKTDPQDKYQVRVEFLHSPDPPLEIADFYVEQKVGKGSLSQQEIESFAGRDDVVSIDLVPKVKLL